MREKGLTPILIVLILAGVILLTPLPRYQQEVCLFMVGLDCSPAGWRLGPSLWNELTGKLTQTNQHYIPSPQPSPNPTDSAEGKFCGGFAANLPENQCPSGYKCQLDDDYPDAGGKCVRK